MLPHLKCMLRQVAVFNVLLKCDLLKHTLEMRTHQHLPDCSQTVQEVLGHLSEYQLCMQCHPTHHHSHQRTSQRFLRSGHRHHLHTQQSVGPCHSMKLHFQCERQHRRVQTGRNCQLLLQQLQISWPWHLLLPVQHHTTVYKRLLQDAQTSNCRATRGQHGCKLTRSQTRRLSQQNTSNAFVQKVLVDFGV